MEVQVHGGQTPPATSTAHDLPSTTHRHPAPAPRALPKFSEVQSTGRKSVAESTKELLEGLRAKPGKRKIAEKFCDDEGDDEALEGSGLPVRIASRERAPKAKCAKKVPAAPMKSKCAKDGPKKSKCAAGRTHCAQFEHNEERVRIRSSNGTSFSIKFSDHGGCAKATMRSAQEWIKNNP